MARSSPHSPARIDKPYARSQSSLSSNSTSTPLRKSTRIRNMKTRASDGDILEAMVDKTDACLHQLPPFTEKRKPETVPSSPPPPPPQSQPSLPKITERRHEDDEAPSNDIFPIMDLPAEIRNEIYRACLTRPFNILLSKLPPTPGSLEDSKVAATEDAGLATDDDSTSEGDSSKSFPSGSSSPTSTQQPSTSSNTEPSPIASPRVASSVRQSYRRRSTSRSRRQPSTITADSSNITMQYGPNGEVIQSIALPGTEEAAPRTPRPQDADPLIVNLLRANRQIYQEARSVLYGENHFTLDLENALTTMAGLHQRSRRQIKHVEVEIPGYNEILERFQETVRLSLRYCWGLKTFVIHMPFTLPGSDGSTSSNTTVYANGFDILRWLPKECHVVLRGNSCEDIEAVVSRNARLAKSLDELAYARRQLISNESERT